MPDIEPHAGRLSIYVRDVLVSRYFGPYAHASVRFNAGELQRGETRRLLAYNRDGTQRGAGSSRSR